MKTPMASCIAAMCAVTMMAQSNPTDAARWLAKAELAPPFVVPASREAWEVKRQAVRAELWQLLGRLPPRPKTPKVETLSREDRGEYVVEKFQFDNEAGALVPGYLLLPKHASAKLPAILYCHWHGGDYLAERNRGTGAEPRTRRWGIRRCDAMCGRSQGAAGEGCGSAAQGDS